MDKFHVSSAYIFLIAIGLIAILMIWLIGLTGTRILAPGNPPGDGAYPAQSSPTINNNGYPPAVAESTLSKASFENQQATVIAEATRITTETVIPEFTAAAEATKLAQLTPNMNGGCYTDENSEVFSLQLPAGWHGFGGHSGYTISNYLNDQLASGKVDPVNTLWIQIQTPLPNNNITLDDVLKSWTTLYKVEPVTYKIGLYDGFMINFNNNSKDGAKEIIILSIKNGKWIIFGLGPGNSQILDEGLSILATLDDSASCLHRQPGT